MANLAVLASGSGSNFEAIAERIKNSKHNLSCLICDRKNAFVFKRAQKLGINSHYVTFFKRDCAEAENEIVSILKEYQIDIIALAGFMRLISPVLIDNFHDKIINIHPSLLPKYPGTDGIKESYESKDPELGITIHRVDYGLDTGPVIMQKSFIRGEEESLDEIESKIHNLEHLNYPAILLEMLDAI